jgi:hypothetical protein
MTLQAAVRCRDGVLLASDSLGVYASGLRVPRCKLERAGPRHLVAIGNCVCWRTAASAWFDVHDALPAWLAAMAWPATAETIAETIATSIAAQLRRTPGQRCGSPEAWFTRVLVAGCDPDGSLAIAAHRTVVEAADVRTLREPTGRLVVAAYDGGAEEIHALIEARHFRASQATTADALRMFAACLDLAEARGRDVGWPIQAAIVTLEGITMTQIAGAAGAVSNETRSPC